MESLDDLVAFINDPKAKSKKQGKKKNAEKGDKNKIDLNQGEVIVETFDKIKLDNQLEINPDASVNVVAEANEVPGEAKNKKKKKKKNTNNNENNQEELEKLKEKQEKLNEYKSKFDFWNQPLSNLKYQNNESTFRIIKDWRQTNPPTRTIEEQYPKEDYPIGKLVEYEDNLKWRSNDAEKKEIDRLMTYELKSLRKAAECQRQTRK
jgi:hypothetical protein